MSNMINMLYHSSGNCLGELNEKSHEYKNAVTIKADFNQNQHKNDFGAGFYCGDNVIQAGTWQCNSEHAFMHVYNIHKDGLQNKLNQLAQLNLYGFEWMLFIAYNRMILNDENNLFRTHFPALYKRASEIDKYYDNNGKLKLYDIICGQISDNGVNNALRNFFTYGKQATDIDTFYGISAYYIGNQYCFHTQKACDIFNDINDGQAYITPKVWEMDENEKSKYRIKKFGLKKLASEISGLITQYNYDYGISSRDILGKCNELLQDNNYNGYKEYINTLCVTNQKINSIMLNHLNHMSEEFNITKQIKEDLELATIQSKAEISIQKQQEAQEARNRLYSFLHFDLILEQDKNVFQGGQPNVYAKTMR